MRERILLIMSLGVSVVLVGMLFFLQHDWKKGAPQPFNFEAGTRTVVTQAGKTNVVIRRQHFMWSEVESTNYTVYIANLRGIGCPEETIRDIIVADVEHLYAQRKRSEVVMPDQQWWRSEPDMNVLESASTQLQALDSEKNALLTQLLGAGWNRREEGTATDPVRLDGPVLSQLSPETKAALFKITNEARTRAVAYSEQKKQAGEAEDGTELARIRDQTRSDLARILTPEQLEEYLLRYSYNATQMRQQLTGFEASSNEFRTIFRSRDPYDQQIQALGSSTDPAVAKQRQDLEKTRDATVAQALGPERSALYAMTQDPVFRQTQADAEKEGLPPEKVLPTFQIVQASQVEINRINADSTLTEEQKTQAVQAVLKQKQDSITKIILGETAETPPLPPTLPSP